MRVMEEIAEMMERDKEESFIEVVEEYEELESSEWEYEDAEEREAYEMGESVMEKELNGFCGKDLTKEDLMAYDFMEEACAAEEGAANEEKALAQDNRGMGVIEIVLIIVVLIGLALIFREGIEASLHNIIDGIGNLVGKFVPGN